MSEQALDLRPAELSIVVPLVACLLALSAWPAAISGNHHRESRRSPPWYDWLLRRVRAADTVIDTPSVDWFALSPSLVALAAAAICLLSAVLLPRWLLRPFAAFICAVGLAGGIVAASLVYWKSPTRI